MDSLGFKLAGSSPESSVSQVKYQAALDEIAKLKKSSKEDDEYFLAKIDHLTKLVDDQDGIVLLNVYSSVLVSRKLRKMAYFVFILKATLVCLDTKTLCYCLFTKTKYEFDVIFWCHSPFQF